MSAEFHLPQIQEELGFRDRLQECITDTRIRLGRLAASGLLVIAGTTASYSTESLIDPAIAEAAACSGTHCDAQGATELSGVDWLGGGGVNVYANNGSAAYDSGVNESVITPSGSSIKSGEEWQCVELVNRLYLSKGWISSTWMGNGNSLKDHLPAGLNYEANGSITSIEPGDVITLDDGGYGHAAIINSYNAATGGVDIVNQNTVEVHSSATLSNKKLTMAGSGWGAYSVQGIVEAPVTGNSGGNPAPNPNSALQMLLTPSQAVYGKVVNGSGGWNRESPDGTITKIAAGGYVQMALANNGEVWARNTDTSGTSWTKESDAGTGADIAVSSTGVQMVRATDNEVWAKNSIGYNGWTGEAGAGTAAAIAVGGDTQMLIAGDGTVYAKNGIGVGGWHQETDAHVASKIAASSTGVQMVEVADGEVWAKQNDINYGNWTGEAGSGTAASIAAGGDHQMLITGDGKVYAKSGVGVGGWNQETDAGVGTAASVSTAGLQMLETTDGQVWTKTTMDYNNWTGEAGPGTAVGVATGG